MVGELHMALRLFQRSGTVRSRYKRIVFKGIWVGSLTFQSGQAAFIQVELTQLSLVTRTHCIVNSEDSPSTQFRRVNQEASLYSRVTKRISGRA